MYLNTRTALVIAFVSGQLVSAQENPKLTYQACSAELPIAVGAPAQKAFGSFNIQQITAYYGNICAPFDAARCDASDTVCSPSIEPLSTSPDIPSWYHFYQDLTTSDDGTSKMVDKVDVYSCTPPSGQWSCNGEAVKACCQIKIMAQDRATFNKEHPGHDVEDPLADKNLAPAPLG